MGTLFLSFTIAIGSAVGLVSMSKALDLDIYTTRIFPLIPIIYAIIYEALEKKRTGETKRIPPSKAKEEMKAGAALIFKNITVGRIAADAGVSLLIKFAFEIVLTALYIASTGQTFAALYGEFGIETVGRFLKGEHPWLGGNEGLYLLSLIAFVTSFGTGLWVGATTKAKAILEGVIAGAVVTVITTMTNMLILYRQIEDMANQMASSMGYALHAGFAVVITLQVLLYGLWSGVAQKAKEERAARKAFKKSLKRQKK
jgi:hypothetical protein